MEKPGTEAGAKEPGQAKPEGEIDPLDNSAFDERLERLIALCVEADFESGTMVGDIRDLLIQDAKQRPKPWSQMSEGQQRDFVRAAEEIAKKVIGKIVIVLAEQDDITVHATLKGYSADGGTFKLKLVARGDMETAQQLYALDGHDVVLISSDSKRFTGQRKDPPIMPNQATLEFADGEGGKPAAPTEITSDPPEHPADDSDLAAGPDDKASSLGEFERVNIKSGMIERDTMNGSAATEEHWEEVREATPEELAAAQGKESTGPEDGDRVNLKTGTVQKLIDDGDPENDADYDDVREATPDELAAAREAQADFDQGGEA